MRAVLRDVGVCVLFCAVTLAATWPLATNLESALAHPQDPAITTWILDWGFHALTTRPLALFDANIFHPHRLTFAFSENLLGITLPLFPLHLAGMEPITVHNVALILGFVLSAYGAFVLARFVTGSTAAAIASGIFFALVPARFAHLTHLQHLWALWLPLLLAALFYFAAKPTAKRAALLAAAFVMNGLTNLHWFAFGSVAIGVTVLVLARRDRRYWIGAAGALTAGLLALLPVLVPYQQAQRLYGLRTDTAETLAYSAGASDWLVAPLQSRWYAVLLGDPGVNPEKWLFPGILILLLSVAGISNHHGRAPLVALTWIGLGFVGSLGLHAPVGLFLFEHVPPFTGIRTPARWAFIAYTGLALLGACGVANLTRRLRTDAGRGARIAIAILLAVELWPIPIRWYLAVPDAPPVYAWLASEPDGGVIAEFPLTHGDQYAVMLRSTRHHRPMINGVSGFEPPQFVRLSSLSAQTPVPAEFLSELEKAGVTTIVVHADRLGDRAGAMRDWLRSATAARELAFVRRFDAEVEGDYAFVTRRHRDFDRLLQIPPDQRIHLERFLAGAPAQNDGTFGRLALPSQDLSVRGKLTVAGFALSPWGIRAVNLRFAGGRVVLPADLVEGREIQERWPWYPMTTHAGFRKDIAHLGLPAGTDLQVEIVDGRGTRTRLPDVWFTWLE